MTSPSQRQSAKNQKRQFPQRGVPGKVTGAGFNWLEATIDVPRKGMVVINEMYYPPWKAWLDGKRVPLYRVNYILQGIVVPAGKHTLRLEYDPLSFRIGIVLWSLTLLLGLLVLLWPQRRRSD